MLAERPAKAPDDEVEWDQKEMTFTEHLRELRGRLMVSLSVVGVLALVLFWPSQFVIKYLTNLYFKGITLHAFGPTDVIFTEFRFSLYGAIVLGLPVILYEVWMFVVPAFHPKTRRQVYAYIFPSIVLAAVGIAFAHYAVIPRVAGALIAITGELAEPTFGIQPTLNLILILYLAFALIFQTPMIMIALARIGLINAGMLRKYRRYAIMGILLLGGLAAPDASPLTMLMLAVPMYVLYEVSLWIIVLMERSWKREAA